MDAVLAPHRPRSIGGLIGAGLILAAVAFVNGGTAILVNRVLQTGAAPKNIGWGTGTAAANVADTALVTEVAPTSTVARTVGTESAVTTTVSGDTYQVAGTITATLTGPTAITEAGTFTSATAGAASLFIRGVFSAINTSVGDAIAFTVKLVNVASVT